MLNQLDLIREEDWDVLIILDACRYDYFSKHYITYFDRGLLKLAISPASNTYEWCKKVLERCDLYDVLYISANPYINSKAKVLDFDARKRFSEIIDCWLYYWDEKLNTVPPETVTKKAKEILKNWKDRAIIHYIQPHFPSLRLGGSLDPFPKPKKKDIPDASLTLKVKRIINDIVMWYAPHPILQMWLKLRLRRGRKLGPEYELFAKFGKKRLIEEYEYNLKRVLASVKELCASIKNKKIVITADHGELLCDNFMFGWKLSHPANYRHKALIQVPWFVMEKATSSQQKS